MLLPFSKYLVGHRLCNGSVLAAGDMMKNENRWFLPRGACHPCYLTLVVCRPGWACWCRLGDGALLPAPISRGLLGSQQPPVTHSRLYICSCSRVTGCQDISFLLVCSKFSISWWISFFLEAVKHQIKLTLLFHRNRYWFSCLYLLLWASCLW